jgi:hypothetical protein
MVTLQLTGNAVMWLAKVGSVLPIIVRIVALYGV